MECIEAVIFDWGGVLIADPAPGLMRYCTQHLGVTVEDYTAAHNRHSEPFQKGLISEEVFLGTRLRRTGEAVPADGFAMGTGV